MVLVLDMKLVRSGYKTSWGLSSSSGSNNHILVQELELQTETFSYPGGSGD